MESNCKELNMPVSHRFAPSKGRQLQGGGEVLTPRCLSRSLVSWSTSSWPVSEVWVKSRADTSGTYWSLRSRSSSWSLKEMPRTGPCWIRFIKWVV